MTGDVEQPPGELPETTHDAVGALDALARAAGGALSEVETREGLEAEACSLLGSVDAYAPVWLGRTTATSERVAVRTADGIDAEALPRDVEALPAPVRRAARDNEVHTGSADLPEGSSLAAALEDYRDEYGEVAAIPLRNGDTVYGIVAVHSATAFEPDEVAALTDLCSLFGYGISALEVRKLLTADSAVELELTVDDRNEPLIGLAADLGCDLSLQGLVPGEEGVTLAYVRLDGVAPDAAGEAAESRFDGARTVGNRDAGATYELPLDGAGVIRTLAASGGVVQAFDVAEGTATVTLEVAPDADVRAIVETLESGFETVDLRAQRQVANSGASRSTFRTSLADDLTDQQRAALEAAYAANYFEWPRGTTAEELANSMDIASPTLHQHLRAAKRKLLEAYFDEAGGPPTPSD